MGDSASCIMISKPGRERMAVAAIDDFVAQTVDDRELIVVAVTDAQWQILIDHVRSTMAVSDNRVTVRVMLVPDASLGELRNIGMRAATRDVLVQWDDDDRYHPLRLACQLEAMTGGHVASCFTSQMYYFTKTSDLYWVDWRRRRPQFASILIPGTIAIRREVALRINYPEVGDQARRGEDGKYLELALAHGTCAEVKEGEYYLRQFHGDNTWDEGRFRINAAWLGLPVADLRNATTGCSPVVRAETAFREAGYATGKVVRLLGGDGTEASSFTG